MSDGIRVRPAVLRSIAETLEARAGADEPLTAAEMTSLATALDDMADGSDPFFRNSPARYAAAEDTIVYLRPRWSKLETAGAGR